MREIFPFYQQKQYNIVAFQPAMLKFWCWMEIFLIWKKSPICCLYYFLFLRLYYILQSKWDAKHSWLCTEDRNGLWQCIVLGNQSSGKTIRALCLPHHSRRKVTAKIEKQIPPPPPPLAKYRKYFDLLFHYLQWSANTKYLRQIFNKNEDLFRQCGYKLNEAQPPTSL